jgi:PAS domain S-box-containing protein
MTPSPPLSTLARAIAQGAHPADLLPELHRELIAATGGTRSVVLQPGRAPGTYRATSGRGFADLGAIALGPAEAAAVSSSLASGPAVCDLRQFPALAAGFAAQSALVIPLPPGPDAGFVMVGGCTLAARDAFDVAMRAAIEFSLALQIARRLRQAAVHQKLQELFLAFSRTVAARLGFGTALDALAHEANSLFGTRRTSIWLHNRRARELTLAASSDPAHAATPSSTATDSPAARGLRLERPHIYGDDDGTCLLAPLRGWRRALGTLVVEGFPSELDDREFLEGASELARQLSVAIENVQLLDDVLQQRRLLEDTFNSLIDLVVVVDADLRVVQMNDAFAERIGAGRAEVFEKPIAGFIGTEMTAWVAERGESDPAGDARTKQFSDERLDGTFSATVTPLIGQDGVPAGRVLVARDITRQIALEREQTALRERLAQSEKLASLGRFVAGIAHEMNNPLQSVLGHLELLITTSEEAKPVRRTLRQIYQEGDRAAKIVRNLLVFAGSRRMTRRRLHVDRVLSRVLSSRAAALRKARITVERRVDDGVAQVTGDPLLLQQAFLNLVINAEQAVEGAAEGRRIEIAVTQAGSMVRTAIRDSGPGIPPDILPHVFDPFFTTKEVGKGTGLGLAITYGIVQEHGGTIAAGNAPGGGAVFTIELPIAAPPGARSVDTRVW